MKNLLILFCFVSLAATCQDRNSASKVAKQDPCPPDVICTMEFKIINLTIIDEAEQVVELDDFYSLINGDKFEVPDDVYEGKGGFYPVATDAQMEILNFKGTEVTFVGLKEGEILVEQKMLIGKDCCHIQLMDGPEKIVLSY